MGTDQIAQIATLSVLVVTLIAIWRSMKAQERSIDMQNELFRSQLLRDRFDMFLTTLSPVTDDEVEDFYLYRDLYVDKSKELYYGENIERIKRCIGMTHMYEYLAFAWELRPQGVPDPLGERWIRQWIKDLVRVTEFVDCHEFYGKDYYPDFYREVQKEVELAKKTTSK
ncbi:MAG: hypothetical protein WBG50_07255 [Desulfomonilaceae bacterium]